MTHRLLTRIIIVIAGLATCLLHAQNTFPSNGNAGIGTTSPLAPLQITSGNPGSSYVAAGSGGANSGTTYFPISDIRNATVTAVGASGVTAGQVSDYMISPGSNWSNTFYGSVLKLTVPAGATNSPYYMWGTTTSIQNYSSYSASVAGASISATNNSTAAGPGNYYGLQVSSGNGNGATGTMGDAFPIYVGSGNAATGTIGNQYDVYAYQNNSGLVTNRYGFAYFPANTGTVTNSYGLYISGLGAGGTYTNTPYDIYVADSGASNYIAGRVGIGVMNPQSQLAVNGKISATEVVVTSSPADYVFGDDYRLAPLSEVAAYIKANHHLPDIPSGADVTENGVSLGDMQSKLLAKIEELTLNAIRSEEQNRKLAQQNQDLEQRLQRVEALLTGKR